MIFVVTTIEEGAVSFFQDATASPAYHLEGYCICFTRWYPKFSRL